MAEELIDKLRTVAIFRGLDEKELQRIVAVGKEVHSTPGRWSPSRTAARPGFHLDHGRRGLGGRRRS